MSPTSDVTRQLRELADLHASGELSDHEYDRAKALLLSAPGSGEQAEPASPWKRRAPVIAAAIATIAIAGVALAAITGGRAGGDQQLVDPSSASDVATEDAQTEPASDDASLDAAAETPDAEPEPVALTDVDWTDLEWLTTCTDSNGPQAVTLEPAGPLGWETPGALAHQANPDASTATPGTVYVVDAETPIFGDVTGDGLADAAFRTECFHGNDSSFSVDVWSHDDGVPVHLPPIVEYSKFDGVIEDVRMVDDAVRIATSEPAPGDDHPHLNGYPTSVVTDWRFVAGRWSPTEVERHEAPPAPVAGDYGSDPELDQLWDGCAAGDIGSCEFLFVRSPVDSRYESFGATCGGRYEDWVCVPH